MSRYEYHKPTSLEEAFQLFDTSQGAKFIAGGTDLLVQMRNRVVSPTALVSLRDLEELQGVRIGETTRIGAGTTITDIIEHPELARRFPILVDASRLVGSVQIRNTATIGGNICNSSPCADTVIALLVLDANIRIQNRNGIREMAIADFFLGPKQNILQQGEILTEIVLPSQPSTVRHAIYKKGRVKMDMSVASVAVLLDMHESRCRKARVSAGSCAPTTLRLNAVEKMFEGQTITEQLLEKAVREALKCVSPICDVRSTDEYRRQLVGVYLGRGVRKIMGWDAL